MDPAFESSPPGLDPATASIRDERLPVLAELLSEPIPGPVRAAVAAAGAEALEARVESVAWTPGSTARVGYYVRVRAAGTSTAPNGTAPHDPTPDGTAPDGTAPDGTAPEAPTPDGTAPVDTPPVDTPEAASSDPAPAPAAVPDQGHWIGPVIVAAGRIPAGAFLVGDGEHEVAVWQVPHDPALPGLPSALNPEVAGQLLSALGVPGGPVTTRLRAYRPGRRAVVEVTGRGPGLHLKVLRPGRAEAVHERHRWLTGHLPVTQSLGVDPQLGVVALQTMPGVTLREVLVDPQALLPSPETLDSLLDRLPEPARDDVALSPIDRVADAVHSICRMVPECAEAAQALAATLGTRDEVPADLPVHGDFYEGQIMIADDAISGLIDLDTYGWGRPGDDHATLLGHLSVYQAMTPQQERIARYGALCLAAWEPRLPPGELRRRVAAVVLSLAPGAFRGQGPGWPQEVRRRLELAQAWVEDRSDQSADESQSR